MKKEKKKMTEEQREEWFDAVKDKDIKTVQRMIAEGIDVNIKSSLKWTALHLACNWGHIDITKLLLDNGADVNMQDNDGWTVLHLACYHGNIIMAELFLSNGADVNIQEPKYWRTPLHLTYTWEQQNVAKLLINNGADVTIKNKYGNTPLDEFKGNQQQYYKKLMQWLTEYHPEKALEYMASENSPSKGVGL